MLNEKIKERTQDLISRQKTTIINNEMFYSESYVNSHYIAKEKVKTLKMVEKEVDRAIVSYQGGGIGTITWATQKADGYNRAVSEINKKVDDLVGEL